MQMLLTMFAQHSMQNMNKGKFFRINIVPLSSDPTIEVEHLLIMEVFCDIPIKYYLAELPLIDNSIRCRLRFYENLIN